MNRYAKTKRALTFVLAVLCLIMPLSGCGSRPSTQTTATSGSSLTEEVTAGITQTTVTSETTATTSASSLATIITETSETSTTDGTTSTSESTAVPTSTESSAENANGYRVLPADAVTQVDLNKDGEPEAISYNCLDEYNFTLTVNDTILQNAGEQFLADWFFLIDLDIHDGYMDMAVQEFGPSDDYQVTFFYFDGSQLVLRGTVPGLICDTSSATISTDLFGTGTIQADGQGGLTAFTRGVVLHTWFHDDPWQIGVNGLLQRIPQDYYPMQSFDLVTGNRLPETAVTMKMDLDLVEQPGSSVVVGAALTGEPASLIQTDDIEWVQLRTKDGTLGWFLLHDDMNVLIGGEEYYAAEVFDGLFFAD